MNLSISNIGVWVFRHYDYYIKRNHYSTVSVMRMNGTLEKYIKDVNQQASELLDALIQQFIKTEGIAEALKAGDDMRWVQAMKYPQPHRRDLIKGGHIPINARGEEFLLPASRSLFYSSIFAIYSKRHWKKTYKI